MSNTKTLGIEDFVSKGRRINLENFSEIQKAKKYNLEKSKKDELEKGQLSDALGYAGFNANNKFKKKGSEIIGKVKEVLDKVTDKKGICQNDMQNIIDELGFAPMEKLSRWQRPVGVSDEELDNLRTYGWEQCSSGCNIKSEGDYSTADTTPEAKAQTKEQSDLCRKYNQLVDCYLDCLGDEKRGEVFLRNVDEKKDYDLTLSELQSLGF